MADTKLEPFNNWPNDFGVSLLSFLPYCRFRCHLQFDISHEERTPIELVVTGNIPAYAAGTLYRTGPGGYQVDTEQGKISMSHWFDGFSQNRRFQTLTAAGSLISIGLQTVFRSSSPTQQIRCPPPAYCTILVAPVTL